jgi:hypothetical protein
VVTAVVFVAGLARAEQAPAEKGASSDALAASASRETTVIEEIPPRASVEETLETDVEETLETDVEETLETDVEETLETDSEAAGEEVQANCSGENDTQPTVAEDRSPMSVRLAEGRAGDRPWGVMAVLDHSLGTGGFIRDKTLRASRAYFAQNWDLRPFYTFDVLDHKLKVMGRFSFEIELSEPDANPARRFKPFDSSLFVTDHNVYTEPLTHIRFNAGMRVLFPTSYESIEVAKRWTAISLIAGASRTLGPLYLKYSFSFSKNFNSSKGQQLTKDAGARTTKTVGVPPARGDVVEAAAGSFPVGLNMSFSISNSFAMTYNFDKNLTSTYSLTILNSFRYGQDNINTDDEFTSPYADDGRGRVDILRPTLDVTYVLDELIGKVYPLPISLMVSLGVTAQHPAQSADNSGIRWPIFINVLGDNQAAHNYANFFFDLIGVY